MFQHGHAEYTKFQLVAVVMRWKAIGKAPESDIIRRLEMKTLLEIRMLASCTKGFL